MYNQYEQYRGMRVWLMTRVSTPRQEEGYGHPSQEQAARETLIDPLELKVLRIIRDTYSGLEFEERKVLHEILQGAKHKEFDILIVDVLDRLGRKGLERELWRMQLRATGARLLTTDPADHADDDSLTGEIIRLIQGKGSEDEVNNTRRRTMNGRRAKAEGRQKDGTQGPKKVVGQGDAPYGYSFTTDERGKRINLVLRDQVIHTDQYGEEWTQVRVVKVIFELAADGVTLLNIAMYLNERGIPSARANSPVKRHRRRRPEQQDETTVWQRATIWRILRCSDYWGERHEFKTRLLPKEPGQKRRRQQTSEDEQVIVPVPAIVTKELAEKVYRRLEQNRKGASRNNHNPEDTLLRAGLARCGHCGASMTVRRDYNKPTKSELGYYISYYCTGQSEIGKCKGCWIAAHTIEDAAWRKVVEIARDPSELEKSVLALRTDDPTATRRANINKKLTEIKGRRTKFQHQLAELMMEGKLDTDTKEFLTAQLSELDAQRKQWETQQAKDEDMYEKWNAVQRKLDELLEECAKLRENIDDPTCNLTYKKQRDFMEYLGITVTVWRTGHSPRFKVECNPPDIMTLIASIHSRLHLHRP